MSNEWKTRISMKGNLYYLIVEAWLQKILSIMTNLHREIQWSCIPGYNEMLLSFAVQLEAVPLAGYTDTMTKVMRTFLSNDSTLNLFVRILFLKTRPYNIQEVAFVTELVDSLFCFLSFPFLIHRLLSTLDRPFRALSPPQRNRSDETPRNVQRFPVRAGRSGSAAQRYEPSGDQGDGTAVPSLGSAARAPEAHFHAGVAESADDPLVFPALERARAPIL